MPVQDRCCAIMHGNVEEHSHGPIKEFGVLPAYGSIELSITGGLALMGLGVSHDSLPESQVRTRSEPQDCHRGSGHLHQPSSPAEEHQGDATQPQMPSVP